MTEAENRTLSKNVRLLTAFFYKQMALDKQLMEKERQRIDEERNSADHLFDSTAKPRNHAILAQLIKAGETVYQAGELPKTVRDVHYEPPKTVLKTTSASIFPPSG